MSNPKVEDLYKINSKFPILIETLREVINSFQITSLKRELSIIEGYVAEGESSYKFIDVVILGQFKVGKSSLINDLIGVDILPVGVIPVTSIVTRLQYAPSTKMLVHFLDHTVKELDYSFIADFITESKNPKNIKKVEVVDLFLPQLIHFPKIRIVDTPGLGSFFKNNSETTLKWLPEIGVALVAMSVERPLSDEDINLLRSMARYAAETKIILTKSDLISAHQLEEVREFIENSLLKAGIFSSSENDFRHPQLRDNHQTFEILPYSIKTDRETHHNRLVEKVFIPLKENFSRNFNNILNYKCNSLIQSCLSYVKVGLESQHKTDRERESLKNSIIDEHLKYKVIKNNLDITAASFKNSNREKVSEVVMAFSKDITQKIENDFQKEFNSWEGNLYKISRKFELWMQNNLKELLYEAGEKAILQLSSYMYDIKNHFDLFAASFNERLSHNIEKVLKIKLNTVALDTEVEKIKQPDILVSYTFDIHIDLLWFLFPMFLLRNIFRKFFQKKIPYEVQKNLSRLTSDIADNINKVIERNRKSVSRYIYNELLTIENVITNQKYESTNFNNVIQKLESISLNGFEYWQD